MKIKSFQILLFLLFLIACQKVTNKSKDVIDKTEVVIKENSNRIISKSKKEIKKGASNTWEKSVKFSFNEFTTTENIRLSQVYLNENIPRIEELNGIKFIYPISFYSCYLSYKADKAEILNFLSNIKTRLPDISDQKYRETSGKEIKKNLEHIEEEFPDFKNKIIFFYELENSKDIQFYNCTKYPNANYLAIDNENGIIYHMIQKIWD